MNNMHYKHIYRNGHPAATLAILEGEEDGHTVFGVALCNKKAGDNYSKKIGRQISSGRINNLVALVYSEDELEGAVEDLILYQRPVTIPEDCKGEFIKMITNVVIDYEYPKWLKDPKHVELIEPGFDTLLKAAVGDRMELLD